MGIEQVLIAPRSPWQNPYAERIIGSIRRECLDHLIVSRETHLWQILSRYFRYHHTARAHLGLAKDTPSGRSVITRPSPAAKVVARPRVGGLSNRYEWRQAA